jgi:predicted hydrocarbon binding protein
MSDSGEEAPQVKKFNNVSPYYHKKSLNSINAFEGEEEDYISETHPANFSEDGTILLNEFNGREISDIQPYTSIDPDTSITPHTDIDPYTMVITYKHDTKEKKSFIYNSISSIDHLLSNNLEPFSVQEKQALAREREAAPLSQQVSYYAQQRAEARAREDKKRKREKEPETETETQASQTSTLRGSPGSSLTGFGGKKYIARGGVGGSLVRRISASISDERARQTRESQDNYELHRSFFLIIWEHFAPNDDIRKRPRERKQRHFTIKLPIYKTDGTLVCSVLLRCVTRGANTAYSVLFEFTQYIHWSIFYSFDIDGSGSPNSGQVSELHFTLNPLGAIPKTRMFFAYTHYIDGLISPVHNAWRTDSMRVSSKVEQVQIMGIVSELMLLTMYQLATAKSYATGVIFTNAALTMRQNIDSIGDVHPANQLTNIVLRHVDLIDCIQQEFRRHHLSLPSDVFIYHLKTDISAAAAAAAGPARPGGGKNINKYLTKINNIKERLKLLKKNKVKNKVKITKLSKSIEDLKAKFKKQKEKEKAKLKKQKEKEKAKLKKQKEKEKAKRKKQKEKENVKRKKTKAKKS